MLALERKINAVMRYCLADDQNSREKAQAEIRALLAKKTRSVTRILSPFYVASCWISAYRTVSQDTAICLLQQ